MGCLVFPAECILAILAAILVIGLSSHKSLVAVITPPRSPALIEHEHRGLLIWESLKNIRGREETFRLSGCAEVIQQNGKCVVCREPCIPRTSHQVLHLLPDFPARPALSAKVPPRLGRKAGSDSVAEIFDFFWLQFRESRQHFGINQFVSDDQVSRRRRCRRAPLLHFVYGPALTVDKSLFECRQFIIQLQEQY
jgi:hypothetical protein